MQHSNLIGGSTAKRGIHCPGSIVLAQRVPPAAASEHAELGTALHDAMEHMSVNELNDPQSVLGWTAKNGITITQELIDTKVAPAWAALMAIFDQYDVEEYMEETRVYFGARKDIFGTTDILARAGNRLLVLDYKFGDGVIVNPEWNYQLMFYGTAAWLTPEMADFMAGVETVAFGIIQPTPRSDETFKLWDLPYYTTAAEEFEAFENRVLFALHVADNIEKGHIPVEQHLNTGDHCTFCKAEAICPKKTGAAQRALALDPKDRQQLADALPLADELESWIRAVRKMAHEQMENGFKVPGYKLVNKRATRKWIDADETLTKVRNMRKIKLEDATTTTLASPAQLEKLCKKLKVDFSQFEDHIVNKSTGTTIATADDPRAEAADSLDSALRGIAEQL